MKTSRMSLWCGMWDEGRMADDINDAGLEMAAHPGLRFSSRSAPNLPHAPALSANSFQRGNARPLILGPPRRAAPAMASSFS